MVAAALVLHVKSMAEAPRESKQIERDLDDLDYSISLLKRDFEAFFSGGTKQLPLEAQRKVERAIKRYSTMTVLSYAQRFRFNTIVARFNSYLDLWNKQMRMKEEGRTPTGGLVSTENKRHQQGQQPEPESQNNQLEKLFQDYLQTRQVTGEGAPKLNFESFCQLLSKQKSAIVQKYNCKDVDFYVKVEDGQAKLKARPIK
jgi:hypothetical protein